MNTATKETTETTKSQTTHIPDENDVATPSGNRRLWRYADGKIVTGRTEDGTLEEREKLVGCLRRIGIHWGETKDEKKPYGQLEIDIETSKGVERLKTSICNAAGELAPSVAAISFATGLLDCAKDELIVCTANQSTKPNKYGKHSTYANVWHLDATTNKTTATARRERTDKSMEDQWDDLSSELHDHPAYAERPASDDDEDGKATTHLSAFCKECAAKGWPTPEQAPDEWMTLASKALKDKATRKTLRDYTDDEWGVIRQNLQEKQECPKLIEPAKARLKTEPAEDGEYNPFD